MGQLSVPIPVQTVALFLDRGRREFEIMSDRNNTPGFGCIISFLSGVKEVVAREMPVCVDDAISICDKWARWGIAAAEKRRAAEINWGSPIIMQGLFGELKSAIGIM